MNDYSYGAELTKILSEVFTLTSGYNYNLIYRGNQHYGRHVIEAALTGRF